jgi:hypothetical protein
MNCTDKLHHKTEREALNHLAWARKQRHQEGSHGLKYLNVYACPCGGGWCVGRAWRGKREAVAVQPKVEPATGLTPGQQRRAAKKAAEKAARQALYQDYHDTLVFCQRLTDNEIARMIALGAKPRTIQQPQATADTPTAA